MNVIQRIVKWNKERNLTNYDQIREGSFIMEELLEYFGTDKQSYKEGISKEGIRKACREECQDLIEYGIPTTTEEQADALGDIIFFAVGALYKLNLNHGTPLPEEVLKRIIDANETKGSETNAEGKIIKDSTFIEPDHS